MANIGKVMKEEMRNHNKITKEKSESLSNDLLAPIRYSDIEKEYLEACKFVDTEIVKTEGLGRAVEILRYERDKLWQQVRVSS